MSVTKSKRVLEKEPVLDHVTSEKASPFRKYQDFYVGRGGWLGFLKYEILVALLGPVPGAAGLFLRKAFYPRVFRRVGPGVVWGRNLGVRHPGRISVGDRTAIDDNCLLDAKGSGEEGIEIGKDVLIARDTIIQAKLSPIKIGDRCIIGSQVQLSSAGGIVIGDNVMVGGKVYIGGGRYNIEDRLKPMRDQGLYSKGAVIIEEDVWIGAGAVILDGVRVGRGSVVGAGAVVRRDIPEYSVAAYFQELVMSPRGEAERDKRSEREPTGG